MEHHLQPVAAVADQVADPRNEPLHDSAELVGRAGFVHLAPGADDATQLGAAIYGIAPILSGERIYDDADVHRGVTHACQADTGHGMPCAWSSGRVWGVQRSARDRRMLPAALSLRVRTCRIGGTAIRTGAPGPLSGPRTDWL